MNSQNPNTISQPILASGFPHIHHPELYNALEIKIADYQNRRKYNNAPRIEALAESIKKDLITHYLVGEDKVTVCYPTIPSCWLRESSEKTGTITSKFSLPPRYIFLRAITEKGPTAELAIDALVDISPDICLLVAASTTAAHIKKMKKRASARGVSTRLLILENLPEEEQAAIAKHSEIILCTALCEGFPSSLLRAIATGRPVIAGSEPINKEIGGPDVFYINPTDRIDLIQAIHALLADPMASKMMGEACAEYARKFMR